MNLSRHFTLEELTASTTAQAEHGGAERPQRGDPGRGRLVVDVLGQPIKVTSGYRGPALNRRVGGAAKSQHLTGEAADLQSPGLSVLALFQLAIRLRLPFDQIIYEVNGAAKWVHISHTTGVNKGEILLGKFGPDGKVSYPKLTAAAALALSEPRTRGPLVEPDYTELRDEPVRRTRKPKAVVLQPGAL